jgi:polyhydroxyalkanoate synthase
VDAMSPTNSLGGNPAALRKLLATGGVSFLHGLENFVGDLARNGGLPAQVDTRKFAVGKNLATTPGSVVYRDPVMELIQYRPMTHEVHERPLLIAPPQINKFYVFDLEPEKSIIALALKGDLQTFAISWKNPTPAESHFGLDTYVGALEAAADAMRDITGSEDINIWGSCSGGITTSAFLANLAARGEPMFAWMRPNDLIWSYWVNNYLLGNAPPAFDVLYWNNDTTRLPARLHADFLDLIGANPYVHAGRLDVRGAPLDMRRVNMDSYVVAGATDHITPWHGCYNTAKLYGARSTFVLANSGHIQSLLNPPGNPRALFWAGAAREGSPQAWLERAARHTGSWWPHWLDWIKARSGVMRSAPVALGSHENPPLGAAPGRYVMEK